MNPTIKSIRTSNRPIYKDAIWTGGEKKEEWAPILRFYDIDLELTDGTIKTFEIEIRKSNNLPQVDWYEELDEFLFSLESSEKANDLREEICLSVYRHYETMKENETEPVVPYNSGQAPELRNQQGQIKPHSNS